MNDKLGELGCSLVRKATVPQYEVFEVTKFPNGEV